MTKRTPTRSPPRVPLTPVELSLKALKASLRCNGQFDSVLTRTEQDNKRLLWKLLTSLYCTLIILPQCHKSQATHVLQSTDILAQFISASRKGYQNTWKSWGLHWEVRSRDWNLTLPHSSDLERKSLLCLRHSRYLLSHNPSASYLSFFLPMLLLHPHLSHRCSGSVTHFQKILFSQKNVW